MRRYRQINFCVSSDFSLNQNQFVVGDLDSVHLQGDDHSTRPWPVSTPLPVLKIRPAQVSQFASEMRSCFYEPWLVIDIQWWLKDFGLSTKSHTCLRRSWCHHRLWEISWAADRFFERLRPVPSFEGKQYPFGPNLKSISKHDSSKVDHMGRWTIT